MKVLVQIPCLNEVNTIETVIKSIPRQIPGVSKLDILVIDDDSTDGTGELALLSGADYVIVKKAMRGLASSSKLGQCFFLANDYDILLNTDGDDQYFQEKIPELIAPIVQGRADLVIGNRRPGSLEHFSRTKKMLQWIGSKVVSFAAGSKIPDAASGFRAYSRVAISKIFITTNFSYAMESIIQSGNKRLIIRSIETGAKPVKRESRLFRNTREHVIRSGAAIVKSLVMYRPLAIFFPLTLLLFSFGALPLVRFAYLSVTSQAGDHIQSILFGSLLVICAVMMGVLGWVAEMSRIQRSLFEEEESLTRLANPTPSHVVLESFSASILAGTK